MPLTDAAATRIFNALTGISLYAHLHTADPATSGNVVTGTGYAGVLVAGGWTATSVGANRFRRNTAVVTFPTPGGPWTTATVLGLWDRMNIAANPSDPPRLVRSFALSEPIRAAINDSIQFAIGSIFLRIEVE